MGAALAGMASREGGERMNIRRLSGIGSMVALVVALSSAYPLAAQAAPASTRSNSNGQAPLLSINWTTGVPSTFGGTRFDGQYDATTKRIYFLGFRTFADATDGSVWYYDVVTQTYTDTGVDMKVPVSNYEIAPLTDSHGLGFYIFGGRDANAQLVTTVQAYYPAANKAVTIPSDPWPGLTPLGCVSLPGTGVTTLNNIAYVMGGFSTAANGCQDDSSAQTWIFDPMAAPGARWTQGPDLTFAHTYITPAVLGGRIYAIGGDTFLGVPATLVAVPTVEAWKPPLGGWNDVAVADLPVGCDESQAFAFTGGALAHDVVLAGCGQWPNATPDTYIYSSTANTWTLSGALNEPVRNHAGAIIGGGKMFVLGGYDCPGNICGTDPTTVSETGRPAPLSGPAGTLWRDSIGSTGGHSAPTT
jgi:hypothetical protein